MIFTFSDADKGFDEIFHGRNIDTNAWISVIPSPDMTLATLYDPQLFEEFYNPKNFKAGMSYIGSLYLYNTVTSVRVAIGKLAGVVGFLKSEFNSISNIFQEAADNMEFVVKAINSIINSDLFQKGLDALGAIPVVGWIIKIIAKVAELVYKVIEHIAKNKIENARIQLTSQPWIPIAEFNKDADQNLNKFTLTKIADGDLEWLFSPRNYFEKFEDFRVKREKRSGNENQPLEKTDFFNITSYNLDAHGLGFIPGGTTIAGAMRFPTSACAEVLNAGELFPTAINTAGSIYQIIQNKGPGLFSIYTDKVAKKWETSIANLIEYGKKSIKLGWTCSPTGEFNTNKFICNKDTEDLYDVKGCNLKTQYGNKVTLPKADGHYTAYAEYLIKLFFKDIPTYQKAVNSKNMNESIPSQALSTLKARQYAVIDSINCMYVNDLTIGSLPRFSAIYNDKTLGDKWEENVTAVLNSKDEWRKVVFWDVPQGPVREKLREVALKNKINPEKPGPIDPGTMQLKIPSILPDPKVPAPFVPKDIAPLIKGFKVTENGGTTKPSSSKDSILLPLALASFGAAYFMFKK